MPISTTPPDADGDNPDDPIPPLEVHADVDALEETLTDAAKAIADAFTPDASADLRDRAREWVDAHGVSEVDGDPVETVIAPQAALTVLLRAAIFDARHDAELTPEKAERSFRADASSEASPAVEWCVLDDVAWLAGAADLAPVIAARHELQQSTVPSADLGALYAAVIDSDARQTLSQFRSPRWAGRAMRAWAANGEETMLDIGVGAGALSASLHPSWSLHGEPRHVVGIDRSRLSVLLAETAFTLGNQSHETLESDFLGTTRVDLPASPDAIVSNPPYTSHDRLDGDDKRRWCEQVRREAGADVSKLSPLYVYFMIHAETLADDGTRVAFLTPQSWLQKQYGRELKEFLLDRFDVKALIRVDPEEGSLFPDADTTAVFTLLEARNDPDPGSETRFITVDDKGFSTLHRAMDSTATDDTDWGMINTVEQSALTVAENWQARFDPIERDVSHLPELSSLASVRSVPPTGKVEVFCLSDDTVETYGISTRHLSRLARHPADVTGYDLEESDWIAARDAGKEVWLLDPNDIDAIPDTMDEFVRQYEAGALTGDGTSEQGTLEQYDAGESTTADPASDLENLFEYLRDSIREHDLRGNYTCRTREYWWRPERCDPAPVVFNNAGQEQSRFVVNEAGLRTTNSFFGVEIDRVGTERKALLAYLNSGILGEVAQQYSETRSGGAESHSVTTVRQFPVIDPSNVSEDIVQGLADAFDALRETSRHSDSHDQIIDTIDALVQRAIEQMRPE
ncbi:Eco57I restriction-modification methylase domain-containing protein [Halorubrum salinarum]|uniref:site-specific DNA-methyltransferase (adenine-specific) n=1 Tax=Halorubrum salinarum TaxID=2739057 RepID=A0A7D3YBE6_9EURY|nr:Eco57I restriction-modification methylase domain-containing protein [Halorubrum salinarum]QKG93485.1 Eco57I restriction-modification methylase domain-containing protein [Halorubrum salinarum]